MALLSKWGTAAHRAWHRATRRAPAAPGERAPGDEGRSKRSGSPPPRRAWRAWWSARGNRRPGRRQHEDRLDRAWNTASGDRIRAASTNHREPAAATAMAERSGLTQVDAAGPPRRSRPPAAARRTPSPPVRRARRAARLATRARKPPSCAAGRARRRIGRDKFRFQRRIHRRVIAGRDRPGRARPGPRPGTATPRGRARPPPRARQTRGPRPHRSATRHGKRWPPRPAAPRRRQQPGAVQQPLEHRRPRHFHGVPVRPHTAARSITLPRR